VLSFRLHFSPALNHTTVINMEWVNETVQKLDGLLLTASIQRD
jgi:hypothetical protein